RLIPIGLEPFDDANMNLLMIELHCQQLIQRLRLSCGEPCTEARQERHAWRLTLELSGSQRATPFGCPLGRPVMRIPTDEGRASAGRQPTPGREPRCTNPRAAACGQAR